MDCLSYLLHISSILVGNTHRVYPSLTEVILLSYLPTYHGDLFHHRKPHECTKQRIEFPSFDNGRRPGGYPRRDFAPPEKSPPRRQRARQPWRATTDADGLATADASTIAITSRLGDCAADTHRRNKR